MGGAPTLPSRTAKSRGLTLVELVIVFAIVTLIAAIAVPGFLRARVRGLQTMCSGNLRQLYTATAMYAADNSGLLPPYTSFSYPEDSRIPALLRTDFSGQLTAAVDPYVRSRNVWFCSADPLAKAKSVARGVNREHTDYRNGNGWYGPGGTQDPHLGSASLDMSMRSIFGDRPPARIMLFTDLLWPCRDSREEEQATPIYDLYYTHGERFNSVYFDGHLVSFARGHHMWCPDI